MNDRDKATHDRVPTANEGGDSDQSPERDAQPGKKIDDKSDNLVINPADDGTQHVEEPANDWPAEDRS